MTSESTIDPSKNPFMVLNNVFESKDSNSVPVIHVISFAAYGEPIIWSSDRRYGNNIGGKHSEENVCFIVKYKNRTSYFRLDWRDSEGLDRERFYGPWDEWESEFLDLKNVNGWEEKKIKTSLNSENQDLFLQKKNHERRWCNFTPIVCDNQFALLFQIFERKQRNQFIYTFLKWNPEKQKSGFILESFRHQNSNKIFKKYTFLMDIIPVEHRYYKKMHSKESEEEVNG